MHSFLIASAYLSMILLPCAVAEWGYIFTSEWWEMRAIARRQQFHEEISIPLNQAVDYGFAPARRVAATSAVAQSVLQKAKTATIAPARWPPSAVDTSASNDAALRVAERLATLMEIHRLVANGLLDLPLDQAMKLAAGSPLVSEQQVVAAPAVAPPRVALPPPIAAPPSAAAPLQRTAAPPAPVRRPAPQTPTAVSAGQSRVSEDVYALYGFDEVATAASLQEQPSAPPDESSGEISVAA